MLKTILFRTSRSGTLVGAVSALLLGASALQAAPTVVKSVVFSRDHNKAKIGPGAPIGITNTFAASTRKIHCTVRLSRLDSKATVRTVWIIEKGTDVAPGTKVYDDKIGPIKDLVFAHFTLDGGGQWPVGAYKVNVFLNGKLARAARFSVK